MKRRLDPCREDVFRIVQWTTETPKQQKLLERSGANVTDVTPSGAYLTLDNGARPFKVEVEWSDDRASVLVFKMLQVLRLGTATEKKIFQHVLTQAA